MNSSSHFLNSQKLLSSTASWGNEFSSLIICCKRNCSLLFVLNKWSSLNLQCDWHELGAIAGTKWLLEQKCSTCVKSMIAWEGVHLCSSHLFWNVTGQCSALLLVVKLNLMHFCANYLKCWRGIGILYLSITPRWKANLNKLTMTWTIHSRLREYCWADCVLFLPCTEFCL